MLGRPWTLPEYLYVWPGKPPMSKVLWPLAYLALPVSVAALLDPLSLTL